MTRCIQLEAFLDDDEATSLLIIPTSFCIKVSLTRKLARHNTALYVPHVDPLEKVLVADMVNLHAFTDEQSFGLLNHGTPST